MKERGQHIVIVITVKKEKWRLIQTHGDADSDEEIESKFEGEKRSWSRHIAKALYKFLEDEDGEVSKIQIHYLKLKAGLLDVIPTKSFFIVQSSAMAMNI